MIARRVAVVVLNWNGWVDSLECLESLERSVKEGIALIVVVDNASTDDSLHRIRNWLGSGNRSFLDTDEKGLSEIGANPQISASYVLIRTRANRGYAAGNNIGIRFALDRAEIEYVFVLNNDAVIESGCISHLVACADSDPSAGIVGSTVVEAGGRLRVAGGGNYNLLSTTTKPSRLIRGFRNSRMDYISGAAQFIRADALRRTGLLSEDYFLYFEELDLTRRMAQAGFGITWCPSSVVYHHGGRAAGSRSPITNRKSSVAEYHSNLSCLIFMRKFHPFMLCVAAPVRFLLKIVHDLVFFQPALLLPLVKAYRDFLTGTRRRQA